MATVLPPPTKRVKTAAAERAREQQDLDGVPDDLGSVRVQFFDQANGKPTGAPVSIPVADATVKNLELLLNTLQGNVWPQIYPGASPLAKVDEIGCLRAHTLPFHLSPRS